jgi:hypothetical protein
VGPKRRDARHVATELEDIAIRWVCQSVGLPVDCAGGIVTGETMANFTSLAAARYSACRMPLKSWRCRCGCWGLGSNGTANSVKQFLAVPTELPIRPDVPIKGLARHSELPAKIADVGFNLPHRSIADIARRSFAVVILNGAPPFLPRARAEANPALVRSDINSRSNSARAAKMPKTSLPAAWSC